MSTQEAVAETIAAAKNSDLPEFIRRIQDRLACPQCHGAVAADESALRCRDCGARYPVERGVADLRPPTRHSQSETDWSEHWSRANQRNIAQRFFSFYRKVVFARTVAYFTDRYFPRSGVFIEAGCGTAETSLRINKRGGERFLVAADLIGPVLEACHPVMDARVCADIFELPFRENSVDGIWNVGVMEHFTRDEIDRVMREFNRVLRPGAPLVLLWPATDSVPQKMLRAAEKVINLKPRPDRFRFHPDEISQLKSTQEGRDVLGRNNFRSLHIDAGLRSLMAFKTVVGAKN